MKVYPIIIITRIKALRDAPRDRKKVNSAPFMKSRDQVASMDNIFRIYKAECELICGFDKANLWQTSPVRTWDVFRLLSKPAHPKKIHPLHPLSIWDICLFNPNIGVIYANDPCIPISLSPLFCLWRSKHNVRMHSGADRVWVPLQIIGSIKEAACLNWINFLPYKMNWVAVLIWIVFMHVSIKFMALQTPQ